MRNLLFTQEDVNRASNEWGCNCGPAALAAVAGLGLNEVRQYLLGFERKRYTNPKMMFEALDSLWGLNWAVKAMPGCPFTLGQVAPKLGLARIQWEGPWTAPGVPIRARYRKTHWIGVAGDNVFDINAMYAGGWVHYDRWVRDVVPQILHNCVPKANGKWHVANMVTIRDGDVSKR